MSLTTCFFDNEPDLGFFFGVFRSLCLFVSADGEGMGWGDVMIPAFISDV